MRIVLMCRSAALPLLAALIGFGVAAQAPAAQAKDIVTIEISIKDHQFQPAEVTAPANTPITLKVKNLDATPAEFESGPLRVEKVIAAGTEGVINLRSLKPGRYEFFDDFHKGTKGILVVQ